MPNTNNFVIDNGVLTRYKGSDRDVVIPQGVTKIGNRAFEYCTNLQSITIPEGVTEIGDGAFYGCKSLQSIVIPEGVTQIGNHAFECCLNLQSIVIPEGVTEIGRGTFQGCENFQSIEIPSGVTEIGDYTFSNCTNLQSIVIPEGVTEIGKSAFSYCTNLQSIVIPQGATKIGDSAFEFCENLQSIVIPECVTKIGDSAFEYCTNLQSIVIPEGVTEIGEWAFDDCHKLKTVTVYSQRLSLGSFAFPNNVEFAAPNLCIDDFNTTDIKICAVLGFLKNTDLFKNEDVKASYIKYIVSQMENLLPIIIKEDLVNGIEIYANSGKITAATYEEDFLTPAVEAKATQCTVFLVNWKEHNISQEEIEKQQEWDLIKDPFNIDDMNKLWEYSKLENGTIRIDKYKGRETQVIIPPYIGITAVSELADNLFFNTEHGENEIETIIIPDGISKIGDYSFRNCKKFIIHAQSGSYAEKYAADNGIEFSAI